MSKSSITPKLSGQSPLNPRKKKIPVWIKNTFNPGCPGTRIGPSTGSGGQSGVKAITSVSKADLITVSGTDSLSFAGLAGKVFSALSMEEIDTLMVTQSSAVNVLCFAVHDVDLKRVKAKLERVFELEILHDYMTALEVMLHPTRLMMDMDYSEAA